MLGMDHFSGTDQAHPLRRMTAAVSGLVKDVEDVDPMFMRTGDRAAVLADLDRLEDRLRLLKLGVVHAAGDLAAVAGFKTVAAWRSAHQRRDRAAASVEDGLAEALVMRWVTTAGAVRDGRVSMEQAGVITRALAKLWKQHKQQHGQHCAKHVWMGSKSVTTQPHRFAAPQHTRPNNLPIQQKFTEECQPQVSLQPKLCHGHASLHQYDDQ